MRRLAKAAQKDIVCIAAQNAEDRFFICTARGLPLPFLPLALALSLLLLEFEFSCL